MGGQGMTAEVAELVTTARREGRVAIGRFTRGELAPVGWDMQLDRGLSHEEFMRRAVATAQARAALTTGPLGNLLALAIQHRRTSASWRMQLLDSPEATRIWNLVVLDLDEPDVVLVQHPDGDELQAELVRLALLTEELAQMAFAAPRTDTERNSGPGTVAVMLAPDRKAQAVPTRIVHHWDKPKAVLVRWSYTLFGGHKDGDWVGRREQTIRGVKPDRVATHLAWRLSKPDPPPPKR